MDIPMTCKEAYYSDLNDIIKAIYEIMDAVPKGKSKAEIEVHDKAAFTASQAIATLGCMKNDHIVCELEDVRRAELAFDRAIERIKVIADVMVLDVTKNSEMSNYVRMRRTEIKGLTQAINLFTGRKITFSYELDGSSYEITEDQFESTEKVLYKSEQSK